MSNDITTWKEGLTKKGWKRISENLWLSKRYLRYRLRASAFTSGSVTILMKGIRAKEAQTDKLTEPK